MKSCLTILLVIMGLKISHTQQEIFCRYSDGESEFYGKVMDGHILKLDDAPWNGGKPTNEIAQLEEVALLFPSEPKVILGLGGSYKNNWKGKTAPNTVRWFLKPPSAAASHNDEVLLPQSFDEAKVEAELVIIIGKTIKDAEEKEAESSIFGYTIGNDIVGHKVSYLNVNNESEDMEGPLLAPGLKICDKFAPFGPFIYTGIEWENRDWLLTIKNKETGTVRTYNDNTSNLVYSPAKIVSDLSKVLTLNPGDIVFTGTSKSLIVSDDDVVTVEINGLGKLVNKIIKK